MACCNKCTLVATLTAVYKRDSQVHYGSGSSENPDAELFEVTPKADEETILPTADKYVAKDIVIKKIPYSETTNNEGGFTAYIASETETSII